MVIFRSQPDGAEAGFKYLIKDFAALLLNGIFAVPLKERVVKLVIYEGWVIENL